MLGLLARFWELAKVSALVEAVGDHFVNPDAVDGSDLRPFLDRSSERSAQSDENRLAQLGLIDARGSLRLSSVARGILSLPRLSLRNVGGLLLGNPANATLSWSDFAHLGDLRDLAAQIVAAAGRKGDAPNRANILLYGPPGTGKSEFAIQMHPADFGRCALRSKAVPSIKARRTSSSQWRKRSVFAFFHRHGVVSSPASGK